MLFSSLQVGLLSGHFSSGIPLFSMRATFPTHHKDMFRDIICFTIYDFDIE
jgi:hypothetical protein